MLMVACTVFMKPPAVPNVDLPLCQYRAAQ